MVLLGLDHILKLSDLDVTVSRFKFLPHKVNLLLQTVFLALASLELLRVDTCNGIRFGLFFEPLAALCLDPIELYFHLADHCQ